MLERSRCVLLQTAMVDYRAGFVRLARGAVDLELIAGPQYFDPSIQTDFDRFAPIIECRNRFILGRRALVQTGILRRCLNAPVLVAEANPRVLSTWFLVIARRVLRRPTVLWGHAWSRRGADSWTNRVRLLLFRSADALLVYTNQQREELAAALGDSSRIFVAANSLYLAEQMTATGGLARCAFVYSGRMVPAKRPELIVDAFLASSLPNTARLLMVGDGPETDRLSTKTSATTRIDWLGRVTDHTALAKIYSQAVAGVSPGYAGLSITQALGFGVPVIVADNEPHAPEVSLVKDTVNGRYFKARDQASLIDVLEAIWNERSDWAQRSTSIAADTRASYSVEAMVDGFVQAVEFASSNIRGRSWWR